MKKTLLSLAFVLVAGTLPAMAETGLPANTFIAEEAPAQYLAKDRLIGVKVKGPDGKIVGDIEDIILSGDHQVVGVVMGTGGFFGLFEKKVGVEIGALQFEVTDGKISASMPAATHDVIQAAPAFQRNSPKKSLFERALEKGQELRDKTGVSAKDAYESAKEKAGPAIEKAKEAAREALEKAKNAAQEAVEKAKEAAQPSEHPAGEHPAGEAAPKSETATPETPAPATPAPETTAPAEPAPAEEPPKP
ncbi:MAG TPA: YtxH domain-containing protein [Hyphomicrobium sp.]|nr:YtxH domain-containing protein [Hyphomicrobium sp.]